MDQDRQQGRARGRGADRARRDPGAGAGPPTRAPAQASGPSLKVLPQPINPGQRMTAPISVPGSQGDMGGAVGGEPISQLVGAMGEMNVRSQTRGRQRGHLGMINQERRTRPEHIHDKRGATGEKVTLCTNLFRFQRTMEEAFFQYHVDFLPDVPNIRFRRYLLKTVEKQLGIDGCNVFDGMLLFTANKIDDRLLDEVVTKNDRTDEIIKINITFTNSVPYSSPIVLQIYNLIFKNKILKGIGLQLIGTDYFNPAQEIDMGQKLKLKIWPGYFTAISEFDSGLNLMVDVNHKVIGSVTVLDVLYEVQKQFTNTYTDECKKAIIGKIVLTRYNNCTYRIDDIDWNQNPTSKFKKKDGISECSYLEYYKSKHDKDIKDLRQPVLLSMPKKKDIRAGQQGPICLIPELCVITGIPDDYRTNFSIMRDLAVHTRLGPHDRAKRMTDLHDQIRRSEQARTNLAKWNLTLDSNLLSIQARTLKPEEIALGRRGNDPKFPIVTYNPDTADWSREMRNNHLLVTKNLTEWAMIFPERVGKEAQMFYDKLKAAGKSLGMEIEEPYVYDVLKKIMCCNSPVPSQVMLMKTISKPQTLMSVATKVALQMNCKLGGEGWAVPIPAMRYAMVIGVDTYHDSSRKGRSVVGIVGSLNKTFTRYYTRWGFQSTHQEMGSCLTLAIAELVNAFKRANENNPPDRVFFYRDGVGDGQLGMVYDFELPQIKQGFKDAGIPMPKLTVFIVKKRINSRFFAYDRNKMMNPRPGTIVDTEATKPQWCDFFLISQSVNQGTVTPTHYNIIEDTNGLPPDALQRLTYKLCHLYFNWQGTVRVPAPCQYAHKVAFLIGQSLHDSPSNHLADKLFYL